jgi:hypothetical protein
MFWVDEFQQILSQAKREMHIVARVAMVGVIISALRSRDSKRSKTEGEDMESHLGNLASYIKP